MTKLKPGRHLSVEETDAVIAQARRMRSVYLRIAVRRLLSWLTSRWSGARTRSKAKSQPDASNSPSPQAAPLTQLSRRPPLRRPLPKTNISRARRLRTWTSAR
jgi:hypothetical protein